MRFRRLVVWAGVLAAVSSCRPAEKTQAREQPAELPGVVRLSPEAVRAAGIETAAVGEQKLSRALTLTGTLAAKPWTADEQTVLSDAGSLDAKLRLAEANFRRLSRLYAEGIAARQDLDAAAAERDQARAAAAQADARRANLGLEEGSSLAGKAAIWGLASLPELDLPRVKAGQSVDVTTAAFPGRRFSGRVITISRSAETDTRNFNVRIAIDDPSGLLRPQMLATFAIATPAAAGPTVPRSALLIEGDGTSVYVAEGNLFRKQRVRIGPSSSDEVPVEEGVTPGQLVVVRGAYTLESERLKSRLRPAEAN